jgi:type II secretory pathway component PulJ
VCEREGRITSTSVQVGRLGAALAESEKEAAGLRRALAQVRRRLARALTAANRLTTASAHRGQHRP